MKARASGVVNWLGDRPPLDRLTVTTFSLVMATAAVVAGALGIAVVAALLDAREVVKVALLVAAVFTVMPCFPFARRWVTRGSAQTAMSVAEADAADGAGTVATNVIYNAVMMAHPMRHTRVANRWLVENIDLLDNRPALMEQAINDLAPGPLAVIYALIAPQREAS